MYEEDFRYFKEHYDESMNKMFSAVSDLYAKYWNDLLHFALFDDGNQTFKEAFDKTHKRYMNDLRVKEARKILVLSCGRGGFSNLITQNTQAEVLGIDISKAQIYYANRFKSENLIFFLRLNT